MSLSPTVLCPLFFHARGEKLESHYRSNSPLITHTHPPSTGEAIIVTMSKSFLKAKEKYNEMFNDAGRADWVCK